MAFSPDGKSVLTGSDDNTARLWDAATGKTTQTLIGHTGSVGSVAFSPNGRIVLTGSQDGTCRLWNARTGQELMAILAGSPSHLAWTPEGYYTGSVEAEGLIAWKVPDNSSRGFRIVGPEQLRDTFYRPDLFKHLLVEGSVELALAKADAERGTRTTLTTVAKEVPPLVIVITPKHLRQTDQTEIMVEAVARSASDHPVESLQLEVNGQPTGRIQRVTDPKPGQVSVEWAHIALQPGENVIRVHARAGGSVGKSDPIKVTRVATEHKRVRLHLLVIGVGGYKLKADAGGYRDLPNAAADARRFGDAFAKVGKGLYSEVPDPVVLLDHRATKDGILDAVQEFGTRMTADDVGVIFFACHGDRFNEKLYLCAHDTDKTRLVRSGVSASQLRDTLAGTKGRKYLFLDACHAGGVLQRGDSPGYHDDLIRELRKEATGMVIATACQGDEIANEGPDGGYFTQALIEGLTGKAKAGNGAVYGKNLSVYVKDRLKELTKELPAAKQQRPIFDGPDVLMDLPIAKP